MSQVGTADHTAPEFEPTAAERAWLDDRIAGWGQSQAEIQDIQDQAAQLQEQLVGGAV